jgi:hypothetical protein
MCALRRELCIDFSELRVIEIRCQCGTTMSFDIASEESLAPLGCPGCRSQFGETFRQLFDAFRTAYRGFAIVGKDSKRPTIGFRIPFDAGDVLES